MFASLFGAATSVKVDSREWSNLQYYTLEMLIKQLKYSVYGIIPKKSGNTNCNI